MIECKKLKIYWSEQFTLRVYDFAGAPRLSQSSENRECGFGYAQPLPHAQLSAYSVGEQENKIASVSKSQHLVIQILPTT